MINHTTIYVRDHIESVPLALHIRLNTRLA